MSTVGEILAGATRDLASVSETPRLDAELLLAYDLGLSRAQLLARLRDPLEPNAIDLLLARRQGGEPLAYIFGTWEFYSLGFEVTPPVLVPRPETEHLVETVVDFVGNRAARVLDLCTGSGCVAVSIAKSAPAVQIVATDFKPACIRLARRNAQRHEVDGRIDVREGDLFDAVPATPFDVVCANPPYVAEGDWEGLSPTIRRYEDPTALLAGADGLDCIRKIVCGVPSFLAPGGLLAIEFGYEQADAIRDLFERAGLTNFECRLDLAGIPRIACGYR